MLQQQLAGPLPPNIITSSPVCDPGVVPSRSLCVTCEALQRMPPPDCSPCSRAGAHACLCEERCVRLCVERCAISRERERGEREPKPRNRCSRPLGRSPATAPAHHTPWPLSAGAGTHAPAPTRVGVGVGFGVGRSASLEKLESTIRMRAVVLLYDSSGRSAATGKQTAEGGASGLTRGCPITLRRLGIETRQVLRVV